MLDGSSTTAPIAAGPGIPARATVEVDDAPSSSIRGPGSRRSCRSARWLPPGRLLDAAPPRWPGSTGDSPGTWCRRGAPRRRPSPAARHRSYSLDQRGVDARPAMLVARRALDSRISAVDRALRRSPSARADALDLVASAGALLLELGERRRRAARAPPSSSSSRFSTLRWCRAQLLDVGLHRLQLLRRADLARVHLRLDLGSPSPRATALRRRAAAPRGPARRALGQRVVIWRASSAPRVGFRAARASSRSGSVWWRWRKRSSAPSCSWSVRSESSRVRAHWRASPARVHASWRGRGAAAVVAGGVAAVRGRRGRHRAGDAPCVRLGAGDRRTPAPVRRARRPRFDDAAGRGAQTGPAVGQRDVGLAVERLAHERRKIGAAESPPKPAPRHVAGAVAEPHRGRELRRGADEPRVGAVVGGAGLAEDGVAGDVGVAVPVPPVTTPRRRFGLAVGDVGSSTRSPGIVRRRSRPCRRGRRPSARRTGAWCTPPLAMVAITVAISSGVASTVPSERVRNWSWRCVPG